MAEKNTTRSEKVRAKRDGKGTRSAARKPRAPQGASQHMPPVLMRGSLADMAQPKRKNKKGKTPKRRFDIELSSPGVEIRLPAVPALSLGWRLLSAVLAVGLLVLFFHLWTSPLYQVQAAELEGTHYLNTDTVNQVLNLYNKPIFMVNPEQIEKDLQRAFPGLMVASSIEVILPATVHINIQERVPLIAWVLDGETLWVDLEGISFEPVGEEEGLITITADARPPKPIQVVEDQDEVEERVDPLEEILTLESFMTPEMVAAILTINQYLPSQAFLTYDPQHGLGWHDEKRGWDVYFGMDLSNIEEKLSVYTAIKAQLKNEGISPKLVSIEHLHAPYYRLEP